MQPNPLNFKIRAFVYCLVVDFIIIKLVLIPYTTMATLLPILQSVFEFQGIKLIDVPTDILEQTHENIKTMIYMMVFVYALLQATAYIGFFLNKNWARKYLKLVALGGILSVLSYLIYQLVLGQTLDLIFLPIILLYGYVFWGLRQTHLATKNLEG